MQRLSAGLLRRAVSNSLGRRSSRRPAAAGPCPSLQFRLRQLLHVHNEYRSQLRFGQVVLVLYQFCTASVLSSSCFRIVFVLTSIGNQNMKPHARSCHGSGRPAPSAAFCPHRLTQRRRQWRARSATHHRYFLIGHTAIKNARNSHENIILTFSNRPKIACFARVLRPTNRQSQPTNHAFLIPVSGIRIVRNFLKTNNGTPF